MARRRKVKYKFTEKKHSIRGIVSMLVSIFTMAGFAMMVENSVAHQGQGSVYLGVGGMFCMVAALVALFFSIEAVREEDTFRILPGVGLFISILASVLWVGIYAISIFV